LNVKFIYSKEATWQIHICMAMS